MSVLFSDLALCRRLEAGDGARRQNGAISARIIAEGEEDLWASIAAAGWNDIAPELGPFMLDLGRVHARQRHDGCLPGSASQRNAERQQFRIAYTRIKWGH